MRDRWTWTAIMDDGTVIRERDAGTFTAVDREHCVAVELSPSRGLLCKGVRVEVDIVAGQRAVFCRRRTVAVQMGGSRETRTTLTVAGAQNGASGAYVHAGDDGRVIVVAGRG